MSIQHIDLVFEARACTCWCLFQHFLRLHPLLLLWCLAQAAGELDTTAGAGVRINASAWDKIMHGALQLYSSYGPSDSRAMLQRLLTCRLLPALMWQGAVQAVLPAAAMWDMAAAVARCGWQSLSAEQVPAIAEAGQAGAAAGGTASGTAGGTAAAAAGMLGAAAAACAEPVQPGEKKKKGSRASSAPAGEDSAAADMAGLIPVRDTRAELVQKMTKKKLMEVQLQLELLTQLLQILTAPFGAAAAGSAAVEGSDAATAATAGSPAAPSYRKAVRVPAWRGLQLACYLSRCILKLWQGPQQEAVQQLPQAVQLCSQLQQLLYRWELELLQRHVYCSLSWGLGYCLDPVSAASLASQQRALLAHHQQSLQQLVLPQLPADTAAATAGSSTGFGLGKFPISEVLMADWVSLNIRSPDLNGDELLRPAAVVYASYGLTAPLAVDGEGAMPARELNPLGPDDLPPVGVSGQGIDAMARASVAVEPPAAAADGDGDVIMADAIGSAAAAAAGTAAAAAAPVSWPRCTVTLWLCPAGSSASSSWGCSCCGRRYTVPPCRAIVESPAAAASGSGSGGAGGVVVQPCVPVCLVCGCRLCPGGAVAAGLPGATAGVKQVLDGGPVLGVGMSLTDVMLPG